MAYNSTFKGGSGFVKFSGTIRLDDKRVLDYFDDQMRRDLIKAGSFVRTTARRSMRRAGAQITLAKKFGHVENIPKRPGKPPRRWMDLPRGGGLYNMMQFAWDTNTQSVVIGPSWFGGTGRPVPGQVEAGGMAKIKNSRRRKRKVGHGGEIGFYGKGSKLVQDTFFGGQMQVRYMKLKTHAQAQRANEFNELLYGPEYFTTKIDAHPYMGPALEKSQQKITEIMGSHA